MNSKRNRVIRMPAPYLRRIWLDPSRIADRVAYPFCLPFLNDAFELSFDRSITIIVGENGTGKSTFLEGIAGKIVGLLEPLSGDERQRVLQASLTLLGDSPILPERQQAGGQEVIENNAGLSILPNRVRTWAKQNEVTSEQLEQVFLIEEGKSGVIASDVPGKNDKEKTYSAYVLAGIAALLATGEPKFDDESARTLCKSLGCFNAANHSAYLRDKGNEFSGSKEKGWVLTSPGLKRGAVIVRGATQDGS